MMLKIKALDVYDSYAIEDGKFNEFWINENRIKYINIGNSFCVIYLDDKTKFYTSKEELDKAYNIKEKENV